jgi:very-short-patch-repair endonuclease
MRKMNEIEQRFYDAFCDYYGLKSFDDEDAILEVAETKGIAFSDLQTQFPIGLSIVDFYIEVMQPLSIIDFAIEIDGHDYHKTKEQRYHDYVRERKLQARGIIVIRFTASEVFVNAESCIEELDKIMRKFDSDTSHFQGEYISLLQEKGGGI